MGLKRYKMNTIEHGELTMEIGQGQAATMREMEWENPLASSSFKIKNK